MGLYTVQVICQSASWNLLSAFAPHPWDFTLHDLFLPGIPGFRKQRSWVVGSLQDGSCLTYLLFYFIFLILIWGGCLLIFREKGRGERERGWGRDGNIVVREKHWLAILHMLPDWGSNPQPRYVPWLGVEPATFCCTGQHSNQLNLLSRAPSLSFTSLQILFCQWENISHPFPAKSVALLSPCNCALLQPISCLWDSPDCL